MFFTIILKKMKQRALIAVIAPSCQHGDPVTQGNVKVVVSGGQKSPSIPL